MPNISGPKLGYIPELDGVRGIAILFVLGNHTPLRNYKSLHSLLPGGFAGVDLFFVLSGFLITTLLVQEFDHTGAISLRHFYLRRALRLGPALLGLLLVFCASSFVLYEPAHARGNCLDALIALCYLSNWVRVWTHNQLGLLAHTWSLSAEEQFYLVWPLILWTLLRFSNGRRYLVAGAAAVALGSWLMDLQLTRLASYRHLCFGLESRVGALMTGCILGVIMSSGVMSDNTKTTVQKCLKVLAPVALAGLLFIAGYCYIIGGLIGNFFYYGFALIALLSATLILDVLLSSSSMIKRLLAMKWLVWLGSVSYGLYLWHYPIFAGMGDFGFKGWTVLLVGTPVTFLIVVVSYYAVEKPILEWKQRFSRGNAVQPIRKP